ncbi:MAG: 50S ribosomal protein L22 [Micavibrio sp.]|nr:50S ribosomal protein L22 [Micavibrio sp.]HCK31989.1 50S ribosomal protein L22 [Rhodospirillaceae bacterium]|tara:strand:- start:93 stop:479 length:387 start_codon:yes stop_codon:yes gene_type:complete
MSQKQNAKRTVENEAMAFSKYVRTSPQKLNLVAETIRGLSAEKALTDLEFSPKRVAQHVRKVLESAVANAENNHNLDIDRLYVSEATVGKTLVMKRFRARARGRVGRIKKPMSNITIKVRERAEEEQA